MPPVGLIKIDVEGFELAVLKEATETLWRDRSTLLIEIEEAHTAVPLMEMIAKVCAYGSRLNECLCRAVR